MKQGILDNESGAVLIVSLILLLVLTLLGITAMQSTTLEEKMAGNLADRNLAFQAAEAALRDAENEIENGSLLPLPDRFTNKYTGAPTDPDAQRRIVGGVGFSAACTNGLCLGVVRATKLPFLDPADARNTVYGARTGAAPLLGTDGVPLPNQPRYIIDFACPVVTGSGRCLYTYTITVRGYGAKPGTQVTLEGIFRKE
ncbi:MAG: hypothetical protein A2091_00395 [Desulfuromonadales bacterium GWD2_61_12]|nr:MAG: hypothetical protein A2005_08420 [Desulfuromonadales bacterium GWC2_61_20]OGR32727.1 MAG: hypothetical protein A2091_00395 [Desulfuromonadales bacterium GWD2_61_12]